MTALDVIRISHVRVDCVVGIHEFERNKTQPLVTQVEMHVDVREAVASDRIEDTVDYAKVRDVIVQVLIDGKFQLIETAADRVARAVLSMTSGPKVHKVVVRIEKPEAIAPALAAVEITRP